MRVCAPPPSTGGPSRLPAVQGPPGLAWELRLACTFSNDRVKSQRQCSICASRKAREVLVCASGNKALLDRRHAPPGASGRRRLSRHRAQRAVSVPRGLSAPGRATGPLPAGGSWAAAGGRVSADVPPPPVPFLSEVGPLPVPRRSWPQGSPGRKATSRPWTGSVGGCVWDSFLSTRFPCVRATAGHVRRPVPESTFRSGVSTPDPSPAGPGLEGCRVASLGDHSRGGLR